MPPTSPQEYLQRINVIIGDEVPDGRVTVNVSWTNRSDAKAAVAQLRHMQTELRVR
jgi:hypothetical protein